MRQTRRCLIPTLPLLSPFAGPALAPGLDEPEHQLIPKHLLAVENELNRRPRKVLGDNQTPAELFEAMLAPPDQPVLRR